MWKVLGKVIIAFILVVTQLPVSTIFAQVDTTKPTVESLSIDKTNVKVGDTITFTVKASDSGSGLSNNCNLYYYSPITKKTETIYLYYNSATGQYEGTLTMKESMESGEWKLWFYRIYDNAENYTSIDGPIEGTSFTLSGTNVDVTKPTVESLSIDKTNVKVGDIITFTVKASDSGSGLSNNCNLYYYSPITKKTETIYLYYNSATGQYEGTLTMKESMESGEWKLWFYRIYDNAENYTSIDGPIEGTSFTLSGTNVDVTKPTVESLSIDKTNVKVGDTITFTVKASDSGSGLSNNCNLYYYSPITKKTETIYLYYNSATGQYKGTLTMDESMEPGEWKLWFYRIYDNAENYTSIDGPIAGSSFTLSDYSLDITYPTFSGISISNSTVDSGESLNISTRVSDDTMVKSVVVNYTTPLSNQVKSLNLTPSSDYTNFSTDFYINGDTEYGEWKVSSVEVTDLNGNKITVTENLTDGNFTVLKPVQPLGHRVVKNNETWSNQVIYGDVYIGPSAILTIYGNVTITGNVYVLGALKDYGGLYLYGTLNAKRVFYGSWPSSYYNGDVVMSGSNSVSSMRVSNYPIESIPMDLYDSSLVVEDGKINVYGATVPVVDVYLNNQWINLNSNGTFRLNDFYIGNATDLVFSFYDVFGNVTTKSYSVIQDTTSPIVEGVKNNEVYNTDRTITFNEGMATLDGASITSGTVVSAEGNHRLVVTDAAGNQTVIEFVIDKTSPSMPTVDVVSDKATSITGKAEPNATIKVQVGTNLLGSNKADSKGKFSVTIPRQKAGETLVVTVTDLAGNVSEASEGIVQWTPNVNEVSDRDVVITGTSEAESYIYVKLGSIVIGKSKTDSTGNFSVEIPLQSAGTKLSIVAKDNAGHYGQYETVVVSDKTAPAAPSINVVSDQSIYITGKAEAGSIVSVKGKSEALGSAKADETGNYTIAIPQQKAGVELIVFVTDAAGNMGEESKVIVQDQSAPLAPTINVVTQISSFVTGTSEPNSYVYIKLGTTVIGKGSANSQGSFSIAIPKQQIGTTLAVVARDDAGNYSKYSNKVVAEKAAPLAPTVNEVTNQSTTIIGNAEENSTVYVKVGAVVIGKGKADTKGNFSVAIPLQSIGTKVSVVVRDEAGNYSPYTYVTALGLEGPLAPEVNKVTNHSTVVTGKGEPNSTVYVKLGTLVIGKGKPDSSGNFTIEIPVQNAGVELGIVVRDNLGKYSPYTKVTVSANE